MSSPLADSPSFRTMRALTVGLALIILIYRHYGTTNLDQVDSMKG